MFGSNRGLNSKWSTLVPPDSIDEWQGLFYLLQIPATPILILQNYEIS
jgi:hypothetical protein